MELVSANPADGLTVDTPVDQIELFFDEAASPVGEGFVVLDPTGVVRAPDSIVGSSDLRSWTLVFDPPLTGGAVGVRWTVQTGDSHPISGSFSFFTAAPRPHHHHRPADPARSGGPGHHPARQRRR